MFASFYSDHALVATVVAAASRTVGPMENSDSKSMAIDDLWELREQVAAKLARELSIKRAGLEERLHNLVSASKVTTSGRPVVQNSNALNTPGRLSFAAGFAALLVPAAH
jgi:hypothetical protein